MVPFAALLARQGKTLVRVETTVLQVNVGLRCNQACRHCHLDAGPDRTEMMDGETCRQVAQYALRAGFAAVDLTGGAPELNPHLWDLIDRLVPAIPRVMLRANLTALAGQPDHIRFLAKRKVVITASFPSLSPSQTDGQRGPGIFHRSLDTLKKLSEAGYGRPESGLELNLVANPAGAFLPPDQEATAKRYRSWLEARYRIGFNQVFTFANVPLGRFRTWLEASGNDQDYRRRLAESFNPAAVDGVMCRSQVSAAWDGTLYDCDFNIAAGLPLAGRRTHVNDLAGPPPAGSPIAVGDHCYTCVAGSGFT
jgi:radical SAM/Cys-rich protein